MQRLFIWVEIPVVSMDRAKTFYERMFIDSEGNRIGLQHL